MTPYITRRFAIDMGHRLLKHESKCRHVHGHRYVVEVTVAAESLDEVGRVIDFSVIKSAFGAWLDKHFDHGFVAQRGDTIIPWLEVHNMKHHVMDESPTIENLVRVWFEGAREVLEPKGVRVLHIRGYETETSWADWGGQ